jgi:hypothetical protein
MLALRSSILCLSERNTVHIAYRTEIRSIKSKTLHSNHFASAVQVMISSSPRSRYRGFCS